MSRKKKSHRVPIIIPPVVLSGWDIITMLRDPKTPIGVPLSKVRRLVLMNQERGRRGRIVRSMRKRAAR